MLIKLLRTLSPSMSQLWCSPNLVCPLSPCRVITFIQGSSTFQDQDFSSQVLCVHTTIIPSSHFLFWLMGTPSAFPRAVPLKYKLVCRETVLGGHGKLRNTGLDFSKHLFWNSFLQRGYGKCITMLYSNHRFWPNSCMGVWFPPNLSWLLSFCRPSLAGQL